MHLRKAALFSSLTLVATGVGVAAPATAASVPLDYVCETPLGPQTFKTTLDTDLPATLAYGQSRAGRDVIKVSVPGGLMQLAYDLLGARSLQGTATATMVVAGRNVPVTATIAPVTLAGDGADVVVTATGALPFKASKVGSHTISSGDYTAAMTLRREDGTEAMALNAPCVAPTGDTTVDKVTVTKDATRTTLTPSAKKGKPARAAVSVKGIKGRTAGTGKVKVQLKKAGKVVKTTKVALRRGAGTASLGKLKKGTYQVVASYGGSANHKGSKATKTLRVK